MKEWFAQIANSFVQTFITKDRWMLFAKGFTVTIRVAVLALLLGIIFGVIVAVIRSAHDSRRSKKLGFGGVMLNIADLICRIYLTVIRGTPMMVQLMIMYFVVFSSTRRSILVAILAFGINSGAYVAEIVRSGIMSVDQGQMEAGRSLGLDYKQTMRHIIIPQAIKNILPALGNEMITLFKDTSLMSVVAAKDLTKAASTVTAVTYQPFMPYVSVAVIYLVCVIILSKALSLVERRLRASDRR